MKLIDAIRLVKRPEPATRWEFSAPIDELCSSLGITELWNPPEELDQRFRSYPILGWICTDTHVGLSALYLDDEPVGCTMQTARKNGMTVQWLSAEHATSARNILLSFADIPEFTVINPDEDIGDDYHVDYVTQALTDEGSFEGRPVRALVWYDGLTNRSTPPQYRREGRAYTEAVPFADQKSNCVLVQDGDEQRVIPIEDFRIAFNVEVPA